MKTMKINGPNLPAVSPQPASSRGNLTVGGTKPGGSTTQAAAPESTKTQSARPVRISRFPEEAAVFAYTRHATVPPVQNQGQVDEYV
jgi:hypothetical protein